MLYSHLPYHNNSIIVKTDAHRKTHEERKQEDFFNNIYLSLYCKGSKGLFEGLCVRGCWRPNINFIFWPHCYDRHIVSFLFSCCWGPLHRRFSEGPLGRVWPSLPHLVSSCLDVYWQLHRGFSEDPLGRVWLSLPHLISNSLEFYWQLLWHPTQLNYIIIQRPHDRPQDLWNRMFNRHQAEITVMQFRGYSLPVYHCSGTMGPSPCPIS